MTLSQRPGPAEAAIPHGVVIADGGRAAPGLETLDGVDRYRADVTIRRLPGVSHKVQQDAPEAVDVILAEWLPERRSGEAQDATQKAESN